MSGLFWAGLANGILGGFQAGESIANAREDREVRKQSAVAEAQRNAELMDLKRQELGMEQQKVAAEAENRRATLDLAREGLGLQKDKARADTAQQSFENRQAEAKLNLLQGEEARKQQLFGIELASKQREEATKARLEKLPQLDAVMARWRTPGAEASPDDVALIRDVTGVDPMKFIDPGTVGQLQQTFEAVRSGKLDPNSPQAVEVGKLLYDPYLQRGIGKSHQAPDGRVFTVESKSWAGLMPFDGKPGLFGVRVHVQGKDDKGQPVDYFAPATVHGTSDDADDALLIDQNMLETPAALAMIVHHGYATNPSVKAAMDAAAQGVKGGKSASEEAKVQELQSRTELNKARATESRAKAETVGKGKPGDPSKLHAARMDDVEKYIEADLSDATGGIGVDSKGTAQALRTQASALLRQNPDLTAEEAYDQARKAVAGAVGGQTVATGVAEYKGPRPWLKNK